MERLYTLNINGRVIGRTEFEYADPPMGVVFGKIIFEDIGSPYQFFKSHCLNHHVTIITDYPQDRLISTEIIPQLLIYKSNKIELQGLGAAISGMDTDGYEVEFYVATSEVMEAEFKHHVDRYYNQS